MNTLEAEGLMRQIDKELKEHMDRVINKKFFAVNEGDTVKLTIDEFKHIVSRSNFYIPTNKSLSDMLIYGRKIVIVHEEDER